MRWRTRRKLIYTTIALLPLVIIAAVIYAATFFPSPTCFDGVQNQNETGVDCGGECERVCQAPLGDPDVVWDRAFRVSDSIYNLTAYIENPNTGLISRSVPYVFRVYDTNNILITERRGEITLLPQSSSVAFAAGVDTDGRQPSRTVFEFTETPFWETPPFQEVRFSTADRSLDLSDSPVLSADITNENTRAFRDITLTALVFDNSGEAVHVSQTVIDRLEVQESESVIFTWRESFSDTADSYRTEIIPTSYQLVE